ncbi:hypothetical protein MMC14_010327 [Varicellaria rhodocarpa]|nr:hypothetical protein [Varicellaria rhodocarpa]
MVSGHHGMQPWTQRPDYATYKSPYGPNYKTQFHFHGISLGRAMKFKRREIHWIRHGTIADGLSSGRTASAFGAVAGVFALFFFSDVPKVRKDIMQKMPVIGDYFVKEIPPSDNPF